MSGAIDTSQKADWENFRNERLDGKPFDLDVHDVARRCPALVEHDPRLVTGMNTKSL